VIVYAVGGPAVPGSHFPVENQVILGNLENLADQDPNLLSKYGVSYTGGGGTHGPGFATSYLVGSGFAATGSGIWYKQVPTVRPIPETIDGELPLMLRRTRLQVERYWDWAGERELEWTHWMTSEGEDLMPFTEIRYLRRPSFIVEPGSESKHTEKTVEEEKPEKFPKLAKGE